MVRVKIEISGVIGQEHVRGLDGGKLMSAPLVMETSGKESVLSLENWRYLKEEICGQIDMALLSVTHARAGEENQGSIR